MNSTLEKRYFVLPRREISYLRFILESYDGIAFVRTLEAQSALIEIVSPASRRTDAEALLRALQTEIEMTEVAPPSIVPPL